MAKAKIYYAQVDLPLHLRPTPSSPLSPTLRRQPQTRTTAHPLRKTDEIMSELRDHQNPTIFKNHIAP
jgi:hypothetical protein